MQWWLIVILWMIVSFVAGIAVALMFRNGNGGGHLDDENHRYPD